MEIKKQNTSYIVSSLIFAGFFGWWLFNYFTQDAASELQGYFSDSYWVLALIGGVAGLIVAKSWGGFKSLLGKSLCFFSLGLLAQVFGQVIYSYYALVQKVEAPYPSIGDIGFFGSIVLYILAIYYLARVAGAKVGAAKTLNKILAVVMPVALLTFSYAIFLKDYDAAEVGTLTKLLDFGYPLGQAFYISMTLLTYFLTRSLLGGIMKNKVLLLLGALFVQYTADYMFLYRFSREQWYAGDVSDALYLVAYFLMTVAILKIGAVTRQLQGQDLVSEPVIKEEVINE
jgi:hypothetical protein